MGGNCLPKILLIVNLLILSVPSRAQNNIDYTFCQSKDYTFTNFFDTIPENRKVKIPNGWRICKVEDFFYVILQSEDTTVTVVQHKLYNSPAPFQRQKLLTVTGNILYDVNYRSKIDTPYAENNIYQHTIQTRLDLVYKNQYPFKLYITSRFSNSAFYRNYTDFNFQFNPAHFKQTAKQRILEAAQNYLVAKTAYLDSLQRLINEKRDAITLLSRSVQSPSLVQKAVEEKERELLKNKNRQVLNDSIINLQWATDYFHNQDQFSMNPRWKQNNKIERNNPENKTIEKIENFRDSIDIKKNKLDTLLTELRAIENKFRTLKSTQELKAEEIRNEIAQAKDLNLLRNKLRQLNLPDSILPKGSKLLMGLQSFSIGRSVADYSELSVKNISITGIQAEYNPRYYFAVAAGKVDYRFRDFIVPNRIRSNQYLALARFGKGARDGSHLIFTYYIGKRQFFNASVTAQQGREIPEYHLAGFTVEGVYKFSRNLSLTGEVAKSTIPYYSLNTTQKKDWMSTITDFNNRNNEAYAVKLLSYFPKTQTRFSGQLRYMGANFQSFSSFNTGTAQLRWITKLEQPFFKRQVNVVSSLQQNDYNNPFAASAYKSSSLLASFTLNLRVKKWPVFSVGYYPSYQLTKLNDNQYSESRYYTMMVSAGYAYRVKETQFSSTIIYSRFFNAATDSGFVYYNSKNILASQSVSWTDFSLLVNLSANTGTDYNMYTIENNGQLSINKVIALGAGMKMIRYSLLSNLQWGYSGNLTLKIPRLGDIQLMIDKGFIPGMNRQLVDNSMGRLIYYKTF